MSSTLPFASSSAQSKPSVTGSGASAAAATPWVERYRPKSLKDISHQREVVATLENAVATGRLPHLLLYGPPGSGKTSVALALCRQLWHPSIWRRRVLELNASDERGISVVRDKIKHFASLAVGSAPSSSGVAASSASSSGSGSAGKGGSAASASKSVASFFPTKKKAKKDDASAAVPMDVDNDEVNKNNEDKKGEEKYPNPPFKIIILDEADTVTPDAQAALRRIIEAHSRVTRFILICNYVTRIIEPLASRCAKFRFQALPAASMKDRLLTISVAENCKVDEEVLDEILQLADGDMRRAVTTLQSVHALSSSSLSSSSQVVDKACIAEIAGLPPPDVVDRLWCAGLQQSKDFNGMQSVVDDVCLSGYSAQMLLTCLLPKVCNSAALSDRSKALLAIRMAEAEKNMMEGADEYLQLMTVCGLAQECFQSQEKSTNDTSSAAMSIEAS